MISCGFTEKGIGFGIVTIPMNDVVGYFSDDSLVLILTSRNSLLTSDDVRFSSDKANSPFGRRVGVRTNETESEWVCVIEW